MQRESGDEGGRRITSLLEHCRHGAKPRGQPIAAVVTQAMLERVPPGKDAGVRRERHDRVRVGEVEADAFTREPIEHRRRGRTTVASQRVAAERVDRDEQDVQARLACDAGFAARRNPQQRDGQHEMWGRLHTW